MKKYIVEFGSALLLYIIVLVCSLNYLNNPQLSYSTQITLTLLPVIPCLLIGWTVFRQLTRLDELQQHIQLQAFALAFLGTAMITFSYGFLENIGFPALSMFVVWPLMATLWGIGVLIGTWRYQ